MDDIELLKLARENEKLLIRVRDREIDIALDRAILDIYKNNTNANVMVAQILAGLKQFLYDCPIIPDLLKIKDAEKRIKTK